MRLLATIVLCARRSGALALGASLALALGACVLIAHRVDVQPVEPLAGLTVKTPVKAHLHDGSTVVYPEGVSVAGGILKGRGRRHDVTLKDQGEVLELPLDSVLAMESFRDAVKGGQTAVVSLLATAFGVAGGLVLAVAIFGSCPTVYSFGADGPVLEAETFSYSIAPLFEARDVDRLRAQPDAEGRLRLDLRNEALETHYINHLELLEVAHAPDELVVPDQRGRLVALSGLAAPATVRDRAGRDLAATLAAADGRVFRTHAPTLERANAADPDDWIDLSVPVAAGTERMALVFRLRNSLLNTVLFYDVMLGNAGARAIDWLGGDLDRISTTVELGRWARERMGLHVSVMDAGGEREVARIPDAGPIAWRDVAAVVPVPPGVSLLRLRLRFVADGWRIERVAAAGGVRDVTARPIALEAVTGRSGGLEPDALGALSVPDQRYLATTPGQRFDASFDVGRATGSRTFLLSSQGYYVEWVRGEWVRRAGGVTFRPSDEALTAALERWKETQASFEERFERDRVPVL